jgi:hypothetical protein
MGRPQGPSLPLAILDIDGLFQRMQETDHREKALLHDQKQSLGLGAELSFPGKVIDNLPLPRDPPLGAMNFSLRDFDRVGCVFHGQSLHKDKSK